MRAYEEVNQCITDPVFLYDVFFYEEATWKGTMGVDRTVES